MKVKNEDTYFDIVAPLSKNKTQKEIALIISLH